MRWVSTEGSVKIFRVLNVRAVDQSDENFSTGFFALEMLRKLEKNMTEGKLSRVSLQQLEIM